jgi:Flp pilus assembly protein TadG
MQKLAFIRRRRIGVSSSDESGQTMIFVVVGLAVVLLAIVGFAVDYGNIWFRRQHAQNAADAACVAAVMDMLNSVSLGTTTTGGVTTGTAIDCASAPTASPCVYASLNGYTGGALATNAESTKVEISFPTSLDGNPIPVCPSPIPPTMKVCIPPSSMTSNPFVTARVTQRVKATFFGLLSAANTVDVPAQASCGLVLSTSPIPLLVLDPSETNSEVAAFKIAGNGTVSIYGGPVRSIQINSSTAGKAIDFNGNSMVVDLTQGGPTLDGSNFGVFAVPTNPPSYSNAVDVPSCTTTLCLNKGSYNPGTRPILDPFSGITAPADPTGLARTGPVGTVPYHSEGCPDPSGCDKYLPGSYASDIQVKNKTAIFDPGIYYLKASFKLDSNSCARPSTNDGDKSGGTFFYFAGSGSLSVAANSGACGGMDAFIPKPSSVPVSGAGGLTYGVACDATSYAGMPANITANMPITGSVLVAPCLNPDASTSLCAPNCSINGGRGYGDPLGAGDTAGVQRGMLFMQNRGTVLASNAMPSWQGGGQFLLSGAMYFHECVTTGTDTGTGCSASTAYNNQLEFGGNPAGTSYVLGDIVVDKFYMHGNGNLAMDLSPNPTYFIFKASLLQ